MKFCTTCGQRLQDGYRFCTNCGTPIRPVSQVEPKPAPAEPMMPDMQVPKAEEVRPYWAEPKQQEPDPSNYETVAYIPEEPDPSNYETVAYIPGQGSFEEPEVTQEAVEAQAEQIFAAPNAEERPVPELEFHDPAYDVPEVAPQEAPQLSFDASDYTDGHKEQAPDYKEQANLMFAEQETPAESMEAVEEPSLHAEPEAPQSWAALLDQQQAMNHNQSNSCQNNYQQQGYQPNDYQNGYQQQGYQPNDYQNGYQQQGYQPNDYQNGYQQNGYQQNSNQQNAYQQQGYQQNAYQQKGSALSPLPATPPGGYQRLDDHRGVLKFVLLNMITCGIYSFFWVYKLAQDINIACAGDGKEATGGLGDYILYSILTGGVYSTCWEFELCNRIKANAPRYGTYVQDNGLTILLWRTCGCLLCGLGPWIATYKLCKNSNALCAAYNHTYGL